MRLRLFAIGLLASAVCADTLAETNDIKHCPPDCTITITIADDGTTCTPSAPKRIEVTHTSAAPVTVTWEVDDPDNFRFTKGREGEKPGIDLAYPYPTYDDNGSSGSPGAPHKKYKWKVRRPQTTDDKKERTYAVRTVRRNGGKSCVDADPVIVNMN